MERCHTKSKVVGVSYVGGFIGEIDYTNGHGYTTQPQIFQSYSEGSVQGGNYVGGFLGVSNVPTRIHQCFSESDVTGNTEVGGFAGGNRLASQIENTYSTGHVVAQSEASGFTPDNYLSQYLYSYSICTVNSKSNENQFLPEKAPFDEYYNLVSYFENNPYESMTTTNHLSLEEMTHEANYYTDWDFETIWAIDEGSSLPYFQFAPEKKTLKEQLIPVTVNHYVKESQQLWNAKGTPITESHKNTPLLSKRKVKVIIK